MPAAQNFSGAKEGNLTTEYAFPADGVSRSKLDYALWHASLGRPVFPVFGVSHGACECRESNGCKRVGKHPRINEWQKKASVDPAIIRRWWGRSGWANCNIGVLTGTLSDLAVIDIDGEAGERYFESLCQQHGWTPSTNEVRTGRGRHLLFKMPLRELRDSIGRLGEGLDIRADGGYILGEGSNHFSGVMYRHIPETATTLADFPESLLVDLLVEQEDRAFEVTVPPAALAGPPIGEGTRNDVLFRLACSLRGRGAEQAEIYASLWQTNLLRCSPSLTHNEVRSIAASAARYEANKRRKTPLPWKKDYFQPRSQEYRWHSLRDYQRGWYRELEDYAFVHYGLLPADTDELFRLAKADACRKSSFRAEIRKVLYDYVEVELADGTRMFFSERFAALREDVDVRSSKASSSGKASAAARGSANTGVPVEATGA